MAAVARTGKLALTAALSLLLMAVTANPVAARSPYQDARQQGMATVDVAKLPAEARRTLRLIEQGGRFPYPRDGIAFGNRERLLPWRERGYYHEYTVATPGTTNRGTRRIIAGATNEYYYTDDHYRSFRRITGSIGVPLRE